MMVSERPTAPPPPPDLPVPGAPPLIPTSTVLPTAPNKIEPSPFLNGFDLVLVLGTIILGFAIASFPVRNAEFFQHAGVGKLLSEGKYEFGKDPFSYSTEGRHWTNPSWLFDMIVYKIHGIGKEESKTFGRAVVIFKAVLIALLAGLLLAARRPGQSLWLGVLCVGLALIAAAPRLTMNPAVMSMFFLGLTIWLLIRADRFTNPWSMPVALMAVFAVWSNCDAWFILGPIAVGVCLLGEFLQQRLQPPATGEARMPLQPLALALVGGVLACMINPHHVGVWRLPVELQGSVGEAVAGDPAFAQLFRSSFEKGGLDLDESQGGNRLNGLAFIALALLNVVAMLLSRGRISWGLLLINTGMLGLAIVRQRAIPFYVVVAAPLTALQFGIFIQGLKDRTFSKGALQGLAALRVAARMFLLIAGLLALTATWPGWLHPQSQQRRLSWDVMPDPSLETAAKLLQKWRDDKRLPTDARSFIIHPDLATYCAFYAPAEKVYFDGRIDLHLPEADTFFKLRQQLLRRPGDPKPPEIDVDKFLTEQKIAFVAMTGRDRQEGINGLTSLYVDRYRDNDSPRWELWTMAGGTSLFGWTRQSEAVVSAEQRKLLLMDPGKRAFGADAVVISDPAVPPSPSAAQAGFVDKLVAQYLDFPAEPTAEAEETFLLNQIQQVTLRRAQNRIESLPLLFGWIGNRLIVSVVQSVTNELVEETIMKPANPQPIAWLAVRTARQGIVASPGYGDGYFALAEAYRSPFLNGVPEELKELICVSNLGRYYLRLPPEQQSNPTNEQAYQAARQLYIMHVGRGRNDLALEFMRRWIAADMTRSRPNVPESELQKQRKALSEQLKIFEQDVRSRENLWLTNTARVQSQLERAMIAQNRNYGLYRRSLQELNEIDTGDGSKLPREQIYAVLFQRIRLNMIVGQAEEAWDIVQMIDDGLEKQRQSQHLTDFDLPAYRGVNEAYRKMKIDLCLVLGKFSEAVQILGRQGTEMAAALEFMKREPQFELEINKKRTPIRMPEMTALLVGQQFFEWLGPAVAIRSNAIPSLLQDRISSYARLFRSLEELHFRLGLVYLEQGNREAAVFQFKQVVRSARRLVVLKDMSNPWQVGLMYGMRMAAPASVTSIQQNAFQMLEMLSAR